MKQPTKEQRLAIYKIALISIQEDVERELFMCNEICHAYQDLLGVNTRNISTNDITALFPEFIAQKPEKIYLKDPHGDADLWWNVKEIGRMIYHQLQIDVLKQCIKQVTK